MSVFNQLIYNYLYFIGVVVVVIVW